MSHAPVTMGSSIAANTEFPTTPNCQTVGQPFGGPPGIPLTARFQLPPLSVDAKMPATSAPARIVVPDIVMTVVGTITPPMLAPTVSIDHGVPGAVCLKNP